MKKIFLIFMIITLNTNLSEMIGQTVTLCYTKPSYSQDSNFAIGELYRSGAALKLQYGLNFSPNVGVCPITYNVVHLTNITEAGIAAAGCQIIDVGMSNISAGSATNSSNTDSEFVTLKEWSDESINNIILTFQGHANQLSSDFYAGIGTNNDNPNSFTPYGQTIFDNVFGTTNAFDQGGGYQGIYYAFGGADQIIVQDATGEPTGLLDCDNGNVYLADVGLVSETGGLTEGIGITSNTDVFYANLMCALANLAINATGDVACDFDFSCILSDSNADCDGDGILNGVDTDNASPCMPAQSIGYTGYDATNINWVNADCDNDGISNGDEDGISDPYNPCDPNPTVAVCINPDGDNDGDGYTVAEDPDDNDPCNPDTTTAACGCDAGIAAPKFGGN